MGLINDFISLIYPRTCVCCHSLLIKDENHVCNLCFISLPKSHYHLEEDSELAKVFYGRILFQKAGAYLLFEKSGRVQKLLHAVKYHKNQNLAFQLGRWYAEHLKDSLFHEEYDCVIPVPLHPKKLKERGFNQSEVFARGMASVWNIPVVTNVLIRTEYTASQTKKTRMQRWENVESKFSVTTKTNLNCKKIILVDDVVTTGATIEACYLALKEAEITQLSVLSLAYAIK